MLSSKVMAHGGASGVLPETRARTVRASPAEHGSGPLLCVWHLYGVKMERLHERELGCLAWAEAAGTPCMRDERAVAAPCAAGAGACCCMITRWVSSWPASRETKFNRDYP